jgi:hypothetical protein
MRVRLGEGTAQGACSQGHRHNTEECSDQFSAQPGHRGELIRFSLRLLLTHVRQGGPVDFTLQIRLPMPRAPYWEDAIFTEPITAGSSIHMNRDTVARSG